MKKVFCFFVLICLLKTNCSFAFSFKDIKNPFKKKIEPPKEKMVETVEQWKIEAQNIPLEQRELKQNEPPKTDKKNYYPTPKYIFEKYNYPQGKRELNIEEIKKDLRSYPYLVADKDCHWVAYPRYYFLSEFNQISSSFFVEKLDTSKTKQKRMLSYNHLQKERRPIVEAGMKEIYPNLFNGLTLVDWSQDSKKVLIKEKVGSTLNGVYKTYLYVYFLPTEVENGYTKKLVEFDEAIKDYFLNYEDIQITKYRYDIEPLGFSADDDNIVISHCFVYDKNNRKVFMGTWGYDLANKQTILYSKTDPIFSLSINGLIIKQVLD